MWLARMAMGVLMVDTAVVMLSSSAILQYFPPFEKKKLSRILLQMNVIGTAVDASTSLVGGRMGCKGNS
jgi:uncharacterized membrane protein